MPIDLQNATLDQLIDWIREQRQVTPQSSLNECLRGIGLQIDGCSEQRIVDLACVDLMQRRRLGFPAAIEQYVGDFPILSRDANLLDLIDADLCVANELGEQRSLDEYGRRFPQLATQIGELIQLSPANSFSATFPQALQTGAHTLPESLVPWSGPPIQIPDWFTADRCMTNRERLAADDNGTRDDRRQGWLVRGRDVNRRIPLALKIVQLPPDFDDQHGESLLNNGESASSVVNPHWIRPCVAAIQHRHLCVVRPWIRG